LHGVECYLTETHNEKVRDNFHTILIAKNYAGVKELNQLISTSNEESHFYYKNRLSFDEFLHISNNIIKISACLASPLNRLEMSNKYYDKLAKHYDYFELQPHSHIDQIRYNQHLCQISEEYKKPLIAGTDAHNINKYKDECRSILLTAKHIEYSEEDSFDLTYKSYDELVNAFKQQDAIPEKYYLQAIENTNIMADSVEDFKLDLSFKYPKLYGDKDREVFLQTIQEKFKQKIDNGIIPKEQISAFAPCNKLGHR
jgi:DNA polymerase-3 subunit alpha